MTAPITTTGVNTAVNQQTLKIEEKETQQSSVFVISSSSEAEDMQERVANNRLNAVADTVYEDAQAKSDNGSKWVAGGTIGGGASLLIGFITCFFCAPAGIAIMAVGGLGGGGAVAYGAHEVSQGERQKNQANRLEATANNEQYTSESTEGFTKGIANEFYGNDDHTYLTQEQLTQAAQDTDTNTPLKGGQYSKNVYVVNPPEDGTSQVAELQVVDIDSGSYDGRTPKDESQDPITGEKRGYNKEVYKVEHEYGQLLVDYVEQTADDGSMTAAETDRLVEIAQALETKDVYSSNTKKEDTDFFDVTGDGHINLADMTMLQNPDEVKALMDATGNQSWNDSNFYNIMKTINPDLNINDDHVRNDLKQKYDVNGDGAIDDADKEFFIKSAAKQASSDINNDGVVDNKDAVIMESYLKANMLRIKNAENTISALNDITGGTGTVEQLKKFVNIEE